MNVSIVCKVSYSQTDFLVRTCVSDIKTYFLAFLRDYKSS